MGDQSKISVIGIGGAGCYVIDYMMKRGVGALRYIVADTNEQLMRKSACTNQILLGENTKPRPFCHLSPEWCRRAAFDDSKLIRQAFHGSDLLIVVAGLGGDTGSGVAPVVCQLARELEIRVCAATFFPFSFEGRSRRVIAEASIERLYEYANEISVTKGDDVVVGQKSDVMINTLLKLANEEMVEKVLSIMDA